MNRMSMVKFGRTLTDRDYGKQIARTILAEAAFPLILDFKGVFSLGSSCGDEVANAVAGQQGKRIFVANANAPVMSCLLKVATDLQLELVQVDDP